MPESGQDFGIWGRSGAYPDKTPRFGIMPFLGMSWVLNSFSVDQNWIPIIRKLYIKFVSSTYDAIKHYT